MKTKFRIIPVIIGLAMVAGLISCEKKTDGTRSGGKLEITLALSQDLSTLKAAKADSIFYPDTTIFSSFQLLISVEGVNGESVFTDKLIPLYSFGDGFVSEQIEIKAGEFYLKKFMVLNNSGQVIFASPLEGSPRAYLVNQPLPLYFSVNPEQTTQIAPEVLPTDSYTPADFGYATFMVQVVKPWPFYVIAELDNPLLMRPSLTTDANLTVYTPDGWSHNFYLEPKVNKLFVRSSEYYEMTVYKDGYEAKIFVSGRELLGTSEMNPYVIKIGQFPYNTLVLQPGPDSGMDARITDLEPDKNFGDYKYFEATSMSEPVLTVMRNTRSLISFDLSQLPKSAVINQAILTLYFDIPIYWENGTTGSWLPYDSIMPPAYGAALQQIVEPWKEYGVSWYNQPKTNEMNQVIIYPFIKNANFIDIDVTSIYGPNPSSFPNYGMMLKLYPDQAFPGFRFVSSDYPDQNMRPKLTINYSFPVYGLDK